MNLRKLSNLSGISVCTLSRVLSGRAREYRISEATEKKVLKLAAQHGYQPNYLARSLNTGSTHTIGVVFTNFVDRFLGLILEGVEAELRSSPYEINVATCENSLALQDESLMTLAHRRVDGIVLYPSAVPTGVRYKLPASLSTGRHRSPMVLVGRDVNVACDKIFFADREAGAQAAKRLMDRGCRRFVFVTNRSTCSSDAARGKGFMEALTGAGVARRDIRTVHCLNGVWGKAPSAGKRVGLFGVNTGLLFHYLEHVRKGRVPEGAHLVSVGPIEGHALLPLPWDTLITPNKRMGELAARTLLWRMAHPRAALKEEHLPLEWAHGR